MSTEPDYSTSVTVHPSIFWEWLKIYIGDITVLGFGLILSLPTKGGSLILSEGSDQGGFPRDRFPPILRAMEFFESEASGCFDVQSAICKSVCTVP